MVYFLFFLLGILSVQYLMPILDSLHELVMLKIEGLKGKVVINTTMLNKQLKKLNEEDENEEKMPAIGFQYTETEEDFDDI